MKDKTAFVYIVCGDEMHINTLNVSLKALKKYSKSSIFVITDSARNTGKIQYDNIIDIKTNPSFTHHQASIFLKTSIHRYLDMEKFLYCYLDNDVLAVCDGVDKIFEQQFKTIGFCPDNITFDYFSPYAVHCDCISVADANKNRLECAIKDYYEMHRQWKTFCDKKEGKVLEQKLNIVRNHKIKNLLPFLKFALQRYSPFTDNIILFDSRQSKKSGAWYNKNNEIILYPVKRYEDFVSETTGFRYNSTDDFWTLANNKYDLTIPRCTHLHEKIKQQFNVDITPDNWQHPNGGVFLFDKNSVNFLERWHELTIKTFNTEGWKVRDQGTLALAFWEYGMQKQNLLSPEFNYIVDYQCKKINFSSENGFTKDNYKTFIKPKLVHVFHHFGDKNWPLWNVIESFLT